MTSLASLAVLGRPGRGLFLAAGLALAACGLAAAPARAQVACTPQPLLQEGKSQLYQRVLTRPGATLTAEPGATGGKAVPALSVLYVYEKGDQGVRVGPRPDCKPTGWLATDKIVFWDHALTVAFANRTNRERTIFFKEQDGLQAILQHVDAGGEAARLRQAAPGEGPVAALEPETPVDARKQFYLLPVLEAKTARFADGAPTRALRIAAVTQQNAGTADRGGAAPAAADAADAEPDTVILRRSFRTGIVFVIDASLTMQKYIDESRDTMKRVLGEIEQAGLQDQVRFGLIGYRDDPKKVKGIQYLTRVFVDPNKVQHREDFEKQAADLSASSISTQAVAEDGWAGIDTALSQIDWSGFAGRFVVLITDASSRDPKSGIASTPFDAQALQTLAREKGVSLLVMHILNPSTPADHAKAQAQYEIVAAQPGGRPLYYPVSGATNSPDFRNRIQALSTALVDLVKTAQAGGAAATQKARDQQAQKPPAAAEEEIEQQIAAIGHAMYLTYLGSQQGAKAPPLFESWAADRDFANKASATLNVRVLLTRAQLSDLQSTVRALVEAYSSSRADPTQLYTQLRSAAAALARDPNKLGQQDPRAINQAILGEYLDGLPYKSRVMSIDQDQWAGMSPGDQQAMIDDLEVKTGLYRRLNDDVTNWVSLAEDAAPDDQVYPVPIDALP